MGMNGIGVNGFSKVFGTRVGCFEQPGGRVDRDGFLGELSNVVFWFGVWIGIGVVGGRLVEFIDGNKEWGEGFEETIDSHSDSLMDRKSMGDLGL